MCQKNLYEDLINLLCGEEKDDSLTIYQEIDVRALDFPGSILLILSKDGNDEGRLSLFAKERDCDFTDNIKSCLDRIKSASESLEKLL